MISMNPKVDDYLSKLDKWQKELEQLRMIVLDCGLVEAYKWHTPVYTFQGKNVISIHGFKEYCIIGFFKGALLHDAKKILVTPGEHTQAGRMIRFTSVKQIIKIAPALKAYIYEAIEVEREGLNVMPKKTSDYKVPEEFQNRLNEDSTLKAAFNALTPGRQRGYLLHFAQAKQSKTREARIEKYIPYILRGKGIGD